jgi:hypothetical protein
MRKQAHICPTIESKRKLLSRDFPSKGDENLSAEGMGQRENSQPCVTIKHHGRVRSHLAHACIVFALDFRVSLCQQRCQDTQTLGSIGGGIWHHPWTQANKLSCRRSRRGHNTTELSAASLYRFPRQVRPASRRRWRLRPFAPTLRAAAFAGEATCRRWPPRKTAPNP